MIVYFNWVSRLPTEINKVTCHYRYVKSLKALFGKPNQAVHNHTLTAAAVAKSLQLWLCATPQMAAHQALPSLRFSRQEHWNGLPFPSPMHENEKWKWSRSIMSDSLHPMDCSPPGSSAHGIFQARVLEWGAIAFSHTLTIGRQKLEPWIIIELNVDAPDVFHCIFSWCSIYSQ